MDMYAVGNELRISVQNVPEFCLLLSKAKAEAEQLNHTIEQLSRFDLSIRFSVQDANQDGDIEAASSAINTMPTK